MSKDKELEELIGPLMGITRDSVIQPVLVDKNGEVIMHREKEMLERLAKMEGQVKSWVDGLLDLNERMRKFQSEHVEEFELLQQMERNTKKGDAFWGKMRDVMDTIEQRLKEMETYKSGHELYHRDSLDVRIDLIYKLLDEVKKHMETNRAKGGWDVSGGENT